MRPFYLMLLLAFLSLNTYAQNTYVPDDNFEQALIDLGYDSGALDDYVLTTNIDTVSLLDLRSKAISDLTGIEDFTELSLLLCSDNNLTSLDVSNNTSLFNLSIDDNNLANLNLGNNSTLTFLFCENNNLTSLDVSNNPALKYLNCMINNLTSIDISNNEALENLYVGSNSLTSLDVSNNNVLELLYCGHNNLTRLSLVNNPFLEYVNCSHNELVGINLKNGKNTRITYFSSFGNPDLECIQVDDALYSSANWTNIDPTSMFSENCYYRRTYSPRIQQELIDSKHDSFTNQDISIFPNPVSNELIISSKMNGHFSIINVNGQTLKQGVLTNGNNNFDLSQLKSGLYFLNIKSDTGSILKKILKK